MSDRFDKGFLYKESDKERAIPEPPTSLSPELYRSEFRRDFARLLHSPAFRRLQGKTQLFPGSESDFFRNRLSHSLEVAQIAKSIAIKINHETDPFNRRVTSTRNWKIDEDLVEFAGLAHDLGHPPFGHNGEYALDAAMRKNGGFEGNAQTLRILVRNEKKALFDRPDPLVVVDADNDYRGGLNLTYRSLAAILKYDSVIPIDHERTDLKKGYYAEEKEIVAKIKKAVTGTDFRGKFKTIECSIMDLADDIAYSTYDLEDALKAGFVSLLDFLTLNQQPELLKEVTRRVWNRTKSDELKIALGKTPPSRDEEDFLSLQKRVTMSLIEIASDVLALSNTQNSTAHVTEIRGFLETPGIQDNASLEATIYSLAYTTASQFQKDGYIRTKFTSNLVGQFIRGVRVKIHNKHLALSSVALSEDLKIKIEALKNYTYCAHIMSPRLKIREYRGQEFVEGIFSALTQSKEGYRLLPKDWQTLYLAQESAQWRLRVVSDFIAGMTDGYALEFYGRLKSENPQTIFKEH